MRVQSWSFNCPFLTFRESTRASEHKIRWLSSNCLISILKTKVGRPLIAILVAILRPNAVLPVAGRPPIMMRELSLMVLH